MQKHFTTKTAKLHEVVRIRVKLDTNSDARVLSALGHPGYGEEYSSKVLDWWLNTDTQSLHQIVYGLGRGR